MTESPSNPGALDRMWRINPATKLMDCITMRPMPDAIELFDGEQRMARIEFRQVVRLVAFKQDLLTTDLVVLALIDGTGRAVYVHEEMPGFKDLFEVLAASFSGINRDWYAQVMTPAFATNEITIWERKPDPANATGK